MLKNYRLGFDLWALLLFLMIMIPNFIWFAVPAPNDILRTDSITKMLDTGASICQILMMMILCVFRNVECKKEVRMRTSAPQMRRWGDILHLHLRAHPRGAFLSNRRIFLFDKKISISPYTITTAICCLLYFASWIVYYIGIVNAVVILGLTIPPCLAFLFFAIDRKNKIAIIPISIFTICHMIYGIVNFII